MTDIKQLIGQARQAQSSGDAKLALQLYQQALLHHPEELGLHAICGNLCVELQRFEEAAGYFRRILSVDKTPAVRHALCYALQELGNTAHNDGQYGLAEACFEETLQHQPKNAVYWYNLGNAQRELGKLKAALSSFQKSIYISPEDADVYNNCGNVQRELGQLDLAIAHYEKALQLKPNLYHALVHLVHQKQHICDWHDLERQVATIRTWVHTEPAAKISPFAFLAMPNTTAAEQNSCASQYVKQHYAHLFVSRSALNFNYRSASKKIRLGYLSADFRLHPLAFLITELIQSHDRTQFEVHAYSYGTDDKTPTRKRLEQVFDCFNDIRLLTDSAAAKKIHADGIDILIDLTGFTQSSRSAIVALKPAPISINWLGYPGSMGAFDNKPLFDYLLADKVVAPNPNDFSEKLRYLPCYQPNNRRLGSASSQNKAKTEHALPENAFIFCSFNQTFKITAEIFALWMRLLKKTPSSVFWLLECNPWAKANLQREAEQAGIQKNRLIFAPRVSNEAHLERHRHAHLFLDTLPYNAHTTASDALWMDLPVLTCMGSTFPARVAASLLQTLGLSELVCHSLDEYEEKALYFATRPEELTRIKKLLREQKETTDLFKPNKFALHLEREYQAVWKAYLLDSGKSA
ncbi:MAG: O-linked N-acetylglucosamine transferase, SPINDLY family protein [Methylophilaceae bacterium]